MKYLAQSDPVSNRPAIELLSEHVRTRFRKTCIGQRLAKCGHQHDRHERAFPPDERRLAHNSELHPVAA